MEVRSRNTSANPAKLSRNVAYHRSTSCHVLGNQPQLRDQAFKSNSEVNLARLAVDKRAAKHSPIKQLQKLEKQDSLTSLRSLNSYLSICEGMDANYLVEDDSVFNNEPEEGHGRLLQVKPKLSKRQSMISGVSVNSLLSLVEEDGHVHDTLSLADNPAIFINAPEDDERENQTLNEHEQPINSASPTKERKERGGTGRTTSDERSQTGRVSGPGILILRNKKLQP